MASLEALRERRVIRDRRRALGRTMAEALVAAARRSRYRGRMKKASEYRRRAEECRALARTMRLDRERDSLLTMAADWDKLAENRSALIRRYPALAIHDEHREDAHSPPGRPH